MRLSQVGAAILAASVAVVPATTAYGQNPPSLEGAWTLDADVILEGEEFPCVYQGSTTLTQVDGAVSGPVTMSLLSGPAVCPAEMTGTLDGDVSAGNLGETIVFGIITGTDPTGGASFEGTFTPAVAGMASPGALVATAVAMQATSGSGSISVDSGPFDGAVGTWTASAPAAPALNPLGLLILVALLLVAGFIALRRQGLQRPA